MGSPAVLKDRATGLERLRGIGRGILRLNAFPRARFEKQIKSRLDVNARRHQDIEQKVKICEFGFRVLILKPEVGTKWDQQIKAEYVWDLNVFPGEQPINYVVFRDSDPWNAVSR